jgi:Uma2 family endonuclease
MGSHCKNEERLDRDLRGRRAWACRHRAEPAFIAEILSPSTEGWYRGGKWRAYQTIPSLRAYLLVSQDEPRAGLYTRDGDSWRFAVLTDAAGALVLPPADARLTLVELYAGTGLANG